MRIFLFDIDGTLINTGGAGGVALLGALRDEFSVPEPGKVPFSGRTDRAICRSLFDLHGIADTADNWQRLREGYLRQLPASLVQRQGHVLAGVHTLLAALRAQQDALLGLLTGNMQQGAHIKLGHFGLADAFTFGSYGDDHYERDDVARTAVRVAGELLDGGAPHEVWVIGDTPLDIQCARAIGARALAVATGIHTKQELLDAKPDVLLDNLAETQQLLELFAEA